MLYLLTGLDEIQGSLQQGAQDILFVPCFLSGQCDVCVMYCEGHAFCSRIADGSIADAPATFFREAERGKKYIPVREERYSCIGGCLCGNASVSQ